jgi:M6 family metalloprotease-like protein
MYRFNTLLLAKLALFSSITHAAIPYKNDHYQFTQPNGEKLTISLEGNTYFAYQRTLDGRLVVFDDSLNGLAYAQISQDGMELISTGILAKKVKMLKNSNGLALNNNTLTAKNQYLTSSAVNKKIAEARKELNLDKQQRDHTHLLELHSREARTDNQLSSLQEASGNVKGLTIIIDFPDERGTISKSQIESFLNDLNYTQFGNAQSVRGYFRSVSGNKLDYTNTVTQYYTAKKNKAYYADSRYSSSVRSQELIKEALDWLEFQQGFDFSTLSTNNRKQIKGLNIFYAGDSDSSWSKGLWPHMARLSPQFCADGVCTDRYQITDMRENLAIGTFVHESGHLITNWPDLYDYDDSSEGSAASFGVMGYGAIGLTNKFKPTPPVAHFRNLAGWDTVTELNPAINTNAPKGKLSHTSASNTSYKWTNPANQNEAFYIENIHRSGQNSEQLDSGLVIWHVDSAGSNSNEWYPYIQMEHADANRDPENNINRGDNNDLYKVAGEFSSTLPNSLSSRGTNSLWWNGQESGLVIKNISDPAMTMSFELVSNIKPPSGEVYTGSLTDKEQHIHPDGRWFQYAGGTIKLALTGPNNADFDLQLDKWTSGGWQKVSSSETSSSEESIDYQASEGYYRILVYSYSGGGSYQLIVNK